MLGEVVFNNILMTLRLEEWRRKGHRANFVPPCPELRRTVHLRKAEQSFEGQIRGLAKARAVKKASQLAKDKLFTK